MEIQKALDELKALKIDYDLDLGIDFEKAQEEINQSLQLQQAGVSISNYTDESPHTKTYRTKKEDYTDKGFYRK